MAKRRKTLKGALIGIGAGALLGAFIPVDPVTCNEPDSTAMCSRGEAFTGGIGLGALLGGLTGYAMRRETWMPVDLRVPEGGDRGPTLLVGPGPTLRVAVRF